MNQGDISQMYLENEKSYQNFAFARPKQSAKNVRPKVRNRLPLRAVQSPDTFTKGRNPPPPSYCFAMSLENNYARFTSYIAMRTLHIIT